MSGERVVAGRIILVKSGLIAWVSAPARICTTSSLRGAHPGASASAAGGPARVQICGTFWPTLTPQRPRTTAAAAGFPVVIASRAPLPDEVPIPGTVQIPPAFEELDPQRHLRPGEGDPTQSLHARMAGMERLPAGTLQRAGFSCNTCPTEAALADAVRRWQQTQRLTPYGILGLQKHQQPAHPSWQPVLAAEPARPPWIFWNRCLNFSGFYGCSIDTIVLHATERWLG